MLRWLKLFIERIQNSWWHTSTKYGIVSDASVRRALLQHERFYWLLAQNVHNRLFRLRRWFFLRGSDLREGRQAISILISLAYAAVRPITFSVLFVAAIFFASRWLWDLQPGSKPTDGTSLLATISQVSAVFLGLYFTTLSLVASTSYKDVPGKLRDIIIQERAGTAYLKFVAFVCVTGILLLYAIDLGFVSVIANSVAVLLALLSVFAFGLLGARLFTFFDPEAVAKHLVSEIAEPASQSASNDLFARDASFQRSFQTRARTLLSAFEALRNFASRGNYEARSLAGSGREAAKLLRWYFKIKPRIPVHSHWFPRKMRHPSYLTAGFSQLQLAANAGVTIPPAEEPENDWFEKEVLNLIKKTLLDLFERRAFEESLTLIDEVDKATQALSYQIDNSGVAGITEFLSGTLHALVASHDGTSEGEFPIEKWAAIDMLLAVPCGMIPSFGKRISSLENAKTLDAITAASVSSSGPLSTISASRMLAQSSELKRLFDFESAAEGYSVSPLWFFKEHLTLALRRDVVAFLDELKAMVEAFYSAAYTNVPSSGWPFVIQRHIEAAEKLRHHSIAVSDFLKVTSGSRPLIGEPEMWKSVEFLDTVRKIRTSAVNRLIELSPTIRRDRQDRRVPDHFGYTHFTLSNEAFFSLIKKDDKRFKQLFPAYFALSIDAIARIRLDLAEATDENRAFGMAELVVELLALSGYGVLFSNIYGGTFSDTVRKCWEHYFAMEKVPFGADALLTCLAYRENKFTLSDRGTLRTSWEQRVEDLLENDGFHVERLRSHERRRRAHILDPISEAFVRYDLGWSAADYFVLTYLAQKEPGNALSFMDRVARLLEYSVKVIRERERPTTDDDEAFP